MGCLDFSNCPGWTGISEKSSAFIKGNLPVVIDQSCSLGQNFHAQGRWVLYDLTSNFQCLECAYCLEPKSPWPGDRSPQSRPSPSCSLKWSCSKLHLHLAERGNPGSPLILQPACVVICVLFLHWFIRIIV